MHITPAKLSSYIDQPLHSVTSINLSNKEITHIDDISCCVQLKKLDLSKNGFKGEGQLVGIQYCTGLTFLKLDRNELVEFGFIERMTSLITLNLGHNQLTRITPHIIPCTKLKALILNNNQLTSLDNLGSLTELNSLILSHNQFREPPKLTHFKHLTKLSLSNNQLKEFPNLDALCELKELNLNSNKLVTIPNQLQYCSSLSILGLGNNLINSFENIQILSQLLKLHDLTLSGNPIASIESYSDQIKNFLPNLRILDGTRFDPKFLDRKDRLKRAAEELATTTSDPEESVETTTTPQKKRPFVPKDTKAGPPHQKKPFVPKDTKAGPHHQKKPFVPRDTKAGPPHQKKPFITRDTKSNPHHPRSDSGDVAPRNGLPRPTQHQRPPQKNQPRNGSSHQRPPRKDQPRNGPPHRNPKFTPKPTENLPQS